MFVTSILLNAHLKRLFFPSAFTLFLFRKNRLCLRHLSEAWYLDLFPGRAFEPCKVVLQVEIHLQSTMHVTTRLLEG